MRRMFLICGAALATLFVAQAGPPLICHPYNIRDARSLPWGTGPGWDTRDPSYNLGSLVNDTLALLDANTPVLVRMETLRRAVVYGSENHAAARSLTAALKDRTGKPSALAYFDYGYFLSSLKQIQWLYKEDLTGGASGYEFIQKALELNPDSAEMHFAAALAAVDPPRQAERDIHLAKARAAKSDALLAENLTTHFR